MDASQSSDQGLAGRLAAIQARVAGAAARVGRAPDTVRLVAVGKTFPVEILDRLVAAGQQRLGENKVQEAEAKVRRLPSVVEWHLVGHLQSNKAARAARIFHWVHSLDSQRLARRLSAAAVAEGRTLRVLAQVDLAGGPGRSGVSPATLPGFLAAVRGLAGLELAGLMTLPPRTASAEGARPYFRRLGRLATTLAGQGLLPEPWDLSMGMSSDFEVAVEEGATLVRVGTALLGPRSSLRE